MKTTSEINPLIAHCLGGKRLILGVCGGIAIYKACELARLLVKHGARVQVVLTVSARKMIAPEVFTALTGEKTWVDQWQEDSAGMMAHIALSRTADGIIVAPATANTIGKIAAGIADDLLSTLILGRQRAIPLCVAPAMNVEMWQKPITQKNMAQLVEEGVTLFNPTAGALACGEEGEGRLIEPEDLLWLIARNFGESAFADLRGRQLLMTLGPTFEKIDPVRGITNISSGAMGKAMAQAGWVAGAQVTAIVGGGLRAFLGINHAALNWHFVDSAQSMHQATMQAITQQEWDGFIAVAAVADYRVENISAQKIKKQEERLQLSLVKNPDILANVAQSRDHRPRVVVGFAAESEQLERHAEEKLHIKKLDWVVANLASEAFGSDYNQGLLISAHQKHPLPYQTKALMALQILQTIFNRS